MKNCALTSEIRKLSDPQKAKNSAWFFKTGVGEYGEGDKFLGLTNPQLHKISRKYKNLPLSDIQDLLASPYHEERLTAVLILTLQFGSNPEIVYNFYLKNTRYINNWDLVDLSAPKIVGAYLACRPRIILYQLAKSKSLWERRIAIISCLFFVVKQSDPKDALKISQLLLLDKQDLIHKAVGWILREVGKRCGEKYLTDFLDANIKQMPRTTLRYAIERFTENVRLKYLKADVK